MVKLYNVIHLQQQIYAEWYVEASTLSLVSPEIIAATHIKESNTYILMTPYNNQHETLLDINNQCAKVTGPASPFPPPSSSKPNI